MIGKKVSDFQLWKGELAELVDILDDFGDRTVTKTNSGVRVSYDGAMVFAFEEGRKFRVGLFLRMTEEQYRLLTGALIVHDIPRILQALGEPVNYSQIEDCHILNYSFLYVQNPHLGKARDDRLETIRRELQLN